MINFNETNLTNCDREQIHIPGSIQPHGVLLVLQEPELTIVQVSENAQVLLGTSAKELLLSPISEYLSEVSFALLQKEIHLTKLFLNINHPLAIMITTKNGSLQLDGILHRSQGLLLLELENAPERTQDSISVFYYQARLALSQLQSSVGLNQLLSQAATEVKQLTGFDRVMIYRFHEDSHGEVVAEAREENLEPFLGLHYPASDIPKQARVLYEKSWLRLIPDATYTPSPLLPSTNPLTGTPLDLSFSVLRSVSKMHCEYLRNMGVRASMSISVLKDGVLWGLIACHQYQSVKHIPYEIRNVCEFLGQIISLQISRKSESEDIEKRNLTKACLPSLIQAMSAHIHLVRGLISVPESLLRLTEANGAAVSYEGEIQLVGQTPDLGQVRRLIDWIQAQPGDELEFHTHSLSREIPEAEAFKGVASGLLAVSLSKPHGNFILWFRPEVIQIVNWAGDPKKPIVTDSGVDQISPRKSFALWKESVHLNSYPWQPWQVNAALELRSAAILEIIARKVDEIKHLNSELTLAVKSRDDFFSVASHELKTPLTALQLHIQVMLRVSKMTKGDLPRDRVLPKLSVVEDQAFRLNQLVDKLLDVSRITAGKLSLDVTQALNLTDVIIQVANTHREEFEKENRELRVLVQPEVTGNWDPTRLSQVVTNLIKNSLKYGGKEPVELTLEANANSAFIRVKDRGIGIANENITRIFERFERVVEGHSFNGLGLGLWITKQLVEAMSGRVSVKSEIGKGSEFMVEIPRHLDYSEVILK